MALKIRVGGRRRNHLFIGPVEGRWFDAERIDSDAVTAAFLHHAPEFCESGSGIPAIFGNDLRRYCLKKMKGQPEPVDAFMGKSVQIFIRVIIHIVRKFVPAFRRAVDRTVKTARYPRADDRHKRKISLRQKGPSPAEHFIFNPDKTAADTVRVVRAKFTPLSGDAEMVSFAERSCTAAYNKGICSVASKIHALQEKMKISDSSNRKPRRILETIFYMDTCRKEDLTRLFSPRTPRNPSMVRSVPQIFDECPALFFGLRRDTVETKRC
jgi:hypothetical protein